MKIHRLLSIIIYLLNHDMVTSRTLAEKFEVSRRTIQRDIEAISLSGIPIVSTHGSLGGYGIIEGYKLDRKLTGPDDLIFIITALKGLYSAFRDQRIDDTLEKFISLSASPTQTEPEQTMFLDFSILQERPDVVDNIRSIEKAIKNKKVIEFEYTDGENRKTQRAVEPLALTYRWHSWYLFAYCRTRKDYRMFKLPRITNLRVIETPFSREPGNVEELILDHEKQDSRRYLDVKLLCKPDIRIAVLEYLYGQITGELENGDFVMELRVPDNERLWFSLILGFGDKVTIIEPPDLRDRLIEKAREISELYQKDDI